MAIKRPSVFKYIDYRQYLKSWYLWMKGVRIGFSYRTFSKWVGLKSPNQLQLIIQGKRNLTEHYRKKYMDVLKMNSRERRYFLVLIRFNQALGEKEKAEAYQEIQSFWKKAGHAINEGQYDYLSKWYYPVLREWAPSENFKVNPAWISAKLYKQASPSQVRKALDDILLWGLLKREGGKFTQTESHITSGEAPAYLAAFQYHLQMLQQAKRALERERPKSRDFSALTFLFPERELEGLKEKIAELRQELIGFIQECQKNKKGDRVFQFNLLLFPLTRGVKK